MVAAPPGARRGLWPLHAAAFASSLDRFVIGSMLVAIAASFEVSLAAASLAAGLYFALYGTMQLPWAAASERLGRVRVMRIALGAGAVSGVLAALAPNLPALVALRAVSGALLAAVVPAALVYVGDTVAFAERRAVFGDLLGALGLATASGILLGGLAVDLASWRVGFLLPAALCAVLARALGRVPEPPRKEAPAPLRAALGRVLRRPAALLVVTLASLEGGAVFGTLTFLAPALEAAGRPAGVAGLVVAAYGLGVVAFTALARVLATRVRPAELVLAGASCLAAGYLAAAVEPDLVGVFAAAILAGAGFALMHSTLQAWATDVVPEARAATVGLFSSCLFVGGALSAVAGAPLASDGRFSLLFALTAAAMVPLGLAGWIGRGRYKPSGDAAGTGGRPTAPAVSRAS